MAATTSTRNPALPWIIATAITALLAVVGFGWGFTQRSAAQDATAAAAAETQQDQKLQADVAALQREYDQVSAKLHTKSNDLRGEVTKLEQLQRQYKQSQQTASMQEATLKQQLAASQDKATLATKCAQVMASGMEVIYNAPTPAKVMHDVVNQMQKAADSCGDVVTFQ